MRLSARGGIVTCGRLESQGKFCHFCKFVLFSLRHMDSFAVLPKATWARRLAEHKQHAQRYTLPARKRKDAGIVHPVEDFLFQYYPFPLALLEKWHPGIGVRLAWDSLESQPLRPPHLGL